MFFHTNNISVLLVTDKFMSPTLCGGPLSSETALRHIHILPENSLQL